MKNSKLRRVLMLMACAVLLVCLSVGATLAYLTSDVKEVKNTFTVGDNIKISLDEAVVYAPGDELERDDFGKVDPDAGRAIANTYKLIPAWTYDKDPTVHLETESGNCYLFVKVENGIANIEAADIVDDPDTEVDETKSVKIATQMAENGWNKLSGVDNVWFYGVTDKTAGDVVNNNAKGATEAKDYVVFKTFTIDNLTSIAPAYASATVTIDAFAIQADGFANAAEAWAAGQHVWEQPTT